MYLTLHAQNRMVERIGINKKACRRLAEKAMNNGLSIDDVCSDTRDWMETQMHYKADAIKAENMKLYGNNLFLFTKDYVLITVITMPAQRFLRMTRSSLWKSRKYSVKENEDDCLLGYYS